MGTLKSKRALVTAGMQGIGKAITEELLKSGCHVLAHYFSSKNEMEDLKELAKKHGVKVEFFQGNLTKETEANACVQSAIDLLGGLDILINNTGSLVARRKLEELDLDFWQTVFDLNFTSMMMVTKAAMPHLTLNENSSIVNLSSLAGRKGGHGGSIAYASNKGAVLTWTRALSGEVGPKGVRVNAVAPGLILGTKFHNTHTSKESADETIKGIPIGRAGEAEDVARAVAYLASEYDGFITGATLDINGGVYCA